MNPPDVAASRWLGYRPEIRVLDCTIRDGGLMNNHYFKDDLVKAVYEANVEAGIDIMEFGYKGSVDILSPDEFGKWKFCREEDLRAIVGDNPTDMKISIMADAGRVNLERDLPQKAESVVDIVRVACYIHQVPEAVDMLALCHERGYETTINLMALSTVPAAEVTEAVRVFAGTETATVYVVDSFGSLYSEMIHAYVQQFQDALGDSGKDLGIHAHNNQQLAFANTIECIIKNVNMLDASMAGLGRGAGNCAMELLLGFLHNPKYHLRPVLKCIHDHIEPMRDELGWGPDVPYMVTGQLNQHPRAAMQFNDGPDKGNIVKFYDQIMSQD